MDLVERSFRLPDGLLELLDKYAPAETQGDVLRELIENWLYDNPNLTPRDNCILGCIVMAEISLEMEREFNPMDEELHRTVEY